MITVLLTLSLIAAEPELPDPEASFEVRCSQEVEGLHAFFQGWFEGSLPNTDEAFARFADVLAEGFVIVPPSGEATPRGALLDALRGAHGSRSPGSADRVWVEDIETVDIQGDLAVVTYIERQVVDSGPRDRRSIAVLRERAGAPNGVVWIHLQETLLPSRMQGHSGPDAK